MRFFFFGASGADPLVRAGRPRPAQPVQRRQHLAGREQADATMAWVGVAVWREVGGETRDWAVVAWGRWGGAKPWPRQRRGQRPRF